MVECYDFITAPRSTRHLRHDQKSLQLYQYRQFNIKEKKTIKQSGAKTKRRCTSTVSVLRNLQTTYRGEEKAYIHSQRCNRR